MTCRLRSLFPREVRFKVCESFRHILPPEPDAEMFSGIIIDGSGMKQARVATFFFVSRQTSTHQIASPTERNFHCSTLFIV